MCMYQTAAPVHNSRTHYTLQSAYNEPPYITQYTQPNIKELKKANCSH